MNIIYKPCNSCKNYNDKNNYCIKNAEFIANHNKDNECSLYEYNDNFSILDICQNCYSCKNKILQSDFDIYCNKKKTTLNNQYASETKCNEYTSIDNINKAITNNCISCSSSVYDKEIGLFCLLSGRIHNCSCYACFSKSTKERN